MGLWVYRLSWNIAELYSPTDRRGQWNIVAAQAGAGKSSLLREYYNTLVHNFSEEEVAVITVGEREREEMWRDIHTNFYEISSTAYTPWKAGNILLLAINEIHRNRKIKAVILDSVNGCNNIIANLPEMARVPSITGDPL